MKTPKVKICGITNLADARAALQAGADFIGFVFYKKSKRYIAPVKAKKIIACLPKTIKTVGVFVNEPIRSVKQIARNCKLNYLQLHGNETPVYAAQLGGQRLIKAIRVKNSRSMKEARQWSVDFFLFDTYSENERGGTGKSFNWKFARAIKKIKTPFFLSGGLTPDNVKKAIKIFSPYAVDVSSGVEKRPGIKDKKLLKEFIRKSKLKSQN